VNLVVRGVGYYVRNLVVIGCWVLLVEITVALKFIFHLLLFLVILLFFPLLDYFSKFLICELDSYF